MLGECLASLTFADERLVLVDTRTLDRTREVARLAGARVEERAFDTFAAQRDAALDLARGDWVLFVDADERVTPALRDQVLRTIAAPEARCGYWIPRHNYLMGRIVTHAGWFPGLSAAPAAARRRALRPAAAGARAGTGRRSTGPSDRAIRALQLRHTGRVRAQARTLLQAGGRSLAGQLRPSTSPRALRSAAA